MWQIYTTITPSTCACLMITPKDLYAKIQQNRYFVIYYVAAYGFTRETFLNYCLLKSSQI
jgi:hypothetical protein